MREAERGVMIYQLRELIRVDEDTGNLFWLPRSEAYFKPSATRTTTHNSNNWNAQFAGKQALNCPDASGHLTGRILNKLHYAHRVVFALVNGFWPTQEIDHINGNPADNKPENLRDVSHAVNHRNRATPKSNTSGVVGVSYNKRLSKWAAHIGVDGKYKHLGFFDTIDKAAAARSHAASFFEFHENHGR